MDYLIAIVGRPNVGKSRIFNRLVEEEKAIVHDYAGVTRDRQYGRGEWYGKNFEVVDTGGFVLSDEEPLLLQMRRQAQLAIEEADLILFVLDGREGLTSSDREIAAMLRNSDKQVFYAVNKVDTWDLQPILLAEFYELGVDCYPVSAEHGVGFDGLMDALAEYIPAEVEDEEELPFARVAVVGKPNVGKSTLINTLLGEERLLTSDIAGTTRDSVDTMVEQGEREYLFIDTAGLRRRKNIHEALEEFSVVQAIRSIDRCDVALLVIDATKGLSAQDKKIASVIVNRGKACVILFNKWDALSEKETNTADEMIRDLREVEMPFMNFAPVVTISALTRQRVHKIFALIDEAFAQHQRRVGTSQLNRLLEELVLRHSPPVYRNRRRLKFYYVSQVAVRPPTFVLVCNHPDGVAPSYRRFLENQIREKYGFTGTPIRTLFRERRRSDYQDRVTQRREGAAGEVEYEEELDSQEWVVEWEVGEEE